MVDAAGRLCSPALVRRLAPDTLAKQSTSLEDTLPALPLTAFPDTRLHWKGSALSPSPLQLVLHVLAMLLYEMQTRQPGSDKNLSSSVRMAVQALFRAYSGMERFMVRA